PSGARCSRILTSTSRAARGGPSSSPAPRSCSPCSGSTCSATASAIRSIRAWASEDGRSLPQRAPVALEEGIVPDTHRVMVGGREVGDLEVRPPEPGHAAGDPGDAAADDDTGAVEGSRDDHDHTEREAGAAHALLLVLDTYTPWSRALLGQEENL